MMNKLMFSLLMAGVISFAACGQSHSEKAESQTEKVAEGVTQNEAGGYGKVVVPNNPVSLESLMSDVTKADGFTGQVTGTVVAACQNKGCWMTLDAGNGQTMMVSFKDYGFFVPKDMAGKKVVVEGSASIKTVSIHDQRHLAEDAGKSEAEINAITEEKTELAFVADGVIVL